MIKIVTFKWDRGIHPKKNLKFTAEHVNILHNMLKRHLHMPFEFICITDNAKDINKNIKILPLWKDHFEKGGCFVRLKLFSKKMKEVIGKRFALIDLDTLIVDDITSIFSRTEEFIIWGERWRREVYCGSFWIMNAGCRHKVWKSFQPHKYLPNNRGLYPKGTDQIHINKCLSKNEIILTSDDGIYNFRTDIKIWEPLKIPLWKQQQREKIRERNLMRQLHQDELEKILADKQKQPLKVPNLNRAFVKPNVIKKDGGDGKLPENARIIFFNGKEDPSQTSLQNKYPWIKEHWY